MSAPTVFISYSHKDEEWKDRLRPHLKMLEQVDRIVIWNGNISSPKEYPIKNGLKSW